MRKIITLALSFVLIMTLSACGKSDFSDGENGGKEIIAVSIVPEAQFAQKVCGEDFEIVTVIPAGASPETYEPTPALMKKLSGAKLYFSIGVQSEETSILPSVQKSTVVVPLHERVKEIYPELTIDGGRDPHIWLSPKRVKLMITEIARTAGEINPENTEKYNANAKKYIAELDELDRKIRSLIGENSGGKFISFHPAFNYFADEYSLEAFALEEHGKEATPKRLAEMVDFARKEEIKVIFYQSESSSKQAVSFAEEIGGKAVMLEPLSYNYTQNLENMAKAISEAIK